MNTATSAAVHTVLLRPLPDPSAGAIVRMSNPYPKVGVTDDTESDAPACYHRLRSKAPRALRWAHCCGMPRPRWWWQPLPFTADL